MKKAWMVFLVFFVLSSCVEEDVGARNSSASTGEKAKVVSKKEIFEGLIISSNATKLRAPLNYLSLRGWVSKGYWIKMIKLVGDGERVKKGDLVGGFKFQGEGYLPKLMEGIAKAEAEAQSGQVSDSSTRQKMLADIQRASLQSDRYGLDMTRGDTVSEREMKNFVIQQDLADFDIDAAKKYLRAQKVSDSATRFALNKKVDLAHEDKVRFHMFEKSFKILAPHDGVVRHGRHPWRNRKIKQGDGIASGMHFASVAKDSAVEITIFFPEKKFKIAMNQKEFFVKSPNGDERFPVDVVSVDSFPQTIGFVKQDRKLPNAREIVYVVHGKFRGNVGGMKSGLEVKVELP